MFATPLIVSLVESSIASLQLYKVLRKAVIFGSSITVFWNGSLRRIWHRLPSQYLSSHAHAICCGKLEWLASERRSSSDGAQKRNQFSMRWENEVFVPKKDIIFRVQIWLASISVQVSSEKTNQKNIPAWEWRINKPVLVNFGKIGPRFSTFFPAAFHLRRAL